MVGIFSSGEWIRKRREALDLTRKALAEKVVCSIDTIKKIEGDIRRPSVQIAELFATHLHIPKHENETFLNFARGLFVAEMFPPDKHLPGAKPIPDKYQVLSRLEALPDQKLFGIDRFQQQTIEQLLDSHRPWLISIEGLGGLGKTTLANEVVHHFIDSDRFADIGWVSAKQESYVTGRGIQPTDKPALDQESLIDQLIMQLVDGPFPVGDLNAKRLFLLRHLKETPTLIVVDNLETAIDYESLLPLLRTLAQPTKFLLTSRMSLHNEGDVSCLSLQELAEVDALAFLRYEAQSQKIGPLLTTDKGTLAKIYQTVGGNPLALKLIVGQANFLTLEQILGKLSRSGNSEKLDDLYVYIYWQAWQMLSEDGRSLLLSLPLVPNGTFAQLSIASKLDDSELMQALAQLKALSLVEVGGDSDTPRYRLHRLTETFLMNEVLHWRSDIDQTHSLEQAFFKGSLTTILDHWRSNPAVHDSANPHSLDLEQEGILKALRLGLRSTSGWGTTKELIFSLASYMERRGHLQKWATLISETIKTAEEFGDVAGQIELMGIYGRALQRQQKSDLVISNYRCTIRLARKSGEEIEAARAASNLGFALVRKKCWWRIETLLCFALEIFDRHEHQHGQAHTNNHLGILFQHMKKGDEATTHFLKACELWQQTGDSHGLIFGYQNLGFIYNDLKMPKKAIEYLEKSEQCVEETGDESQRAANYANIAVSYDLLGDLAKAEKYGKKALSYFQAQEDFNGVCQSWEILGTISKHQNRIEETEQYYASALNGYQNLGNAIGEQHLMELMK